MADDPNSGSPEGPTRPEGLYSQTGPGGGGMVEQQAFANKYNEAAQAHAQQQPSPEQSEKQQALLEATQALGLQGNEQGQQKQHDLER